MVTLISQTVEGCFCRFWYKKDKKNIRNKKIDKKNLKQPFIQFFRTKKNNNRCPLAAKSKNFEGYLNECLVADNVFINYTKICIKQAFTFLILMNISLFQVLLIHYLIYMKK